MFPSWETLPHERLSPGVDTVGARLMLLRRLAHPDDARLGPPLRVVVTTARSLLQPMTPDVAKVEPVTLSVGAEFDFEERDRAAGRAGLHPGRHGRQARRVRGPRRHPRRLRARPPSTRCASSSGATRSPRCGCSRSPTSARSPRSPVDTLVAVRLPRAAAHRRGAGAGRRSWPSRPPRSTSHVTGTRRRHAGQARRGHPGRRDGGAAAGAAARRSRAADRSAGRRARRCWCATRRRSAPGPPT